MIIIISPILVITTMIMIIYSQGIFFIIPCVDVYEKIDMRTQLFCVPPQEVRSDGLRWFAILFSISTQILTKDSVTVSVNAVMYYRVADAISAVRNTSMYFGSCKKIFHSRV